MALFYNPSISIDKFKGGYKAAISYTELQDTETNDSKNVIYGVNSDLFSKDGSL